MFKRENIRKNFLRVKQIADQNLGRAEKSEVLSDDLQTSEKKVDTAKHVYSTTCKKLSTSLLSSGTSDLDKRIKKVPENAVGFSMIESAQLLGPETIMGQIFEMCGKCESALAQKHLQYELDVEKEVIEPMQEILDVEIPQITKLKKALSKVTLDMDSAKSRWNAAVRQTQVPGVNMTSASAKADVVKDELEEASNRVDQARDALTTEIFHFMSKEAEHTQNLLSLLEAQAKYHRQALEEIEKVIPKMRETLHCNPTKPVYGMALEEHLRVTNRDIALVLETCILYLLETGLDEEGLFRIAGMASKVKKLKASFDAGIELDDDAGELDQHTVAGALKQYLRELPEPLLTYKLYPDFIAAVQKPDEDQKLQALWCVVDRLPKPNYDNFRYLIKFLAKLVERREVNKMSPGNIAIVIGPNLIWPEGDSGQNMMNTGILSQIIEAIITHADWFFPGDVNFAYTPLENSTPHKTEVSKHQSLERSASSQSGSSGGTPHYSPANRETASPVTQPQTPPNVSRSPSVSPGTSSSNLTVGAPLAESEDLHPIAPRRPTRKPAPPPPTGEKPYTVAVSASVKPGHPPAQSQTWPRQVVLPQESESIGYNDAVKDKDKQSEKKPSLPERPHPPDRVSSLPGHGHSVRPTLPPPVVPPGHQRSASTGTPVSIPGVPLPNSGGEKTNSVDQGKGRRSSGTPEKDTDIANAANNQLPSPDSSKLNTNSLNRQSIARPPRPMPPPPPPPENTITEETHL